MAWIAEDDPVKVKVINDGPVMDFFILLEKQYAQAKKQQQKQRIRKTK